VAAVPLQRKRTHVRPHVACPITSRPYYIASDTLWVDGLRAGDRHPTQEISRRPNCVLSLKLDSFSGIVKIVTGNSTDSVDDLPELEANCGVNLATFLRCDVETLDGLPSLPAVRLLLALPATTCVSSSSTPRVPCRLYGRTRNNHSPS
jgi:hypothetical protein